MVAIPNFISLSIIILVGSQQAASRGCNEIKFVELGNSGSCPEEGNYAMPGDCQAYIKCFCQLGVLESFLASCSKGELFVDGKCQKESDVQSCPQANCTEKEVFSGTQKIYDYSCPATETTTEANDASSTTEESAAGPAEKSTFETASSATATGFSAFTLFATLVILLS